ncbi:hypothetical protein BJ742DRAFT_134689 [Cladochytrium replicatum]|nr:hypothetical protein BJ742DRAFT_134689 [Cladochytrium replicatum]
MSAPMCELDFALEPDLFGIGARTAFMVAAYFPVLLWLTADQKPDTITAHLVALSYIIACAIKYSLNQLHPINTLIALNIASLWFAAGQARSDVISREPIHIIARNLIRIGYNAVKLWVWAIMPLELKEASCTGLVYARILSFELKLDDGYRIVQIVLAAFIIAQTILQLVEINFFRTGDMDQLVFIPKFKWFAMIFITGPPTKRKLLKWYEESFATKDLPKDDNGLLSKIGLKRIYWLDIFNLALLGLKTLFVNLTICQRLSNGAVDNWTIGQVFALAAAVGTCLGAVFNSCSTLLKDRHRGGLENRGQQRDAQRLQDEEGDPRRRTPEDGDFDNETVVGTLSRSGSSRSKTW